MAFAAGRAVCGDAHTGLDELKVFGVDGRRKDYGRITGSFDRFKVSSSLPLNKATTGFSDCWLSSAIEFVFMVVVDSSHVLFCLWATASALVCAPEIWCQ